MKHTKGSLRVIIFYNSPQSILNEAKIDSVFLHNYHVPTIFTGDFNAKHILWNCRPTNFNRRRLTSLSSEKRLTVEAPDGHTWFQASRNHSSDVLDIFVTKNLPRLTSISNHTVPPSDHDPVVMEVGFTSTSSPLGWMTTDHLRLPFLLERLEFRTPKLQSPDEGDAPGSSSTDEINSVI